MANKQVYIACFNKKLEEFINDLITTFPEDDDFRTFKSSLVLLKNIDERKPQMVFHAWIPTFKQQILDRNESFFLNNDYNDLRTADSDITSELISRLKHYWSQLDEANRDIVWKYLMVLVQIDDKCASFKNWLVKRRVKSIWKW